MSAALGFAVEWFEWRDRLSKAEYLRALHTPEEAA
jgi:hypothetical protein